MAQRNMIILLALGAGAFILLSKKQPIVAQDVKPAPGGALPHDNSKGPPVDTGGSDTDEGSTATPSGGSSGSSSGSTSAPKGFKLGSDPFPAFAMALTLQARGQVWYTKHPTSGRWGEASKDFSPTEGYKNIGALARNYNVIEVQDDGGDALWKPFLWNAYNYPVSFPLQSF